MLKNFFDISDFSKDELEDLIFDKIPYKDLYNKNIACLYEKPSTRTRISFAVGINKLKGSVIDLKFDELNFVRKETLEDTFKAMGCYLDGLVFRTSSHNNLLLASNFMKKPVINALSDQSHPCQILADLITLYDHFKTLDLVISWFGDFNNVLYSLVEAVNLLDSIKLNIFSDKDLISNNNWHLSNKINLFDDINYKIIEESNCIMTDVFESMNDQNDENKIKKLLKFQVNKNVMNNTNKDCIFMHCLPATVGMEVTEEVINSNKSIVWKQAENRLPAQMRLMQCIDW